MRLHLTLSGTFHRTPLNQSTQAPVSLEAWMQTYQAVATQVRRRSPELLRQQFGLQFISEPILVQLLQQAHQKEAEIYQIPALRWLQPLESPFAQPTLYRYQFVSAEAKIALQPDDPQIPSFYQPGETSLPGVYEIVVEGDRYPGLSQAWLTSLWQQVQQVWQSYSASEKIQMALSSATVFHFHLRACSHKVSVEISELPIELREAIAYLQQPQANFSLSTSAKTAIQQYQDYSGSLIQFPPNLSFEPSIHPQHQFLIGKKNRRSIENLVNQAQQFLLVSSYIIEDISLTQLICKKAATLPQGVWILTDLRDEVVDRIDTQVENQANLPEVYQRTDERKIKCLTMLLDAGAQIRGGLFHLKTYISEQAAYLGSCNLTGGSLDFNREGGLICQGTTTHSDLLQYFTRFWRYQTRYDVLPSLTQGNCLQRSLNHEQPTFQFSSRTLLTPSQYRNDLQEELNQFKGQIEIYSRGFSPDAKITLLGSRVAYIGGVNFQFNAKGFSLIDLMYKTSDYQEIDQIHQQLAASVF